MDHDLQTQKVITSLDKSEHDKIIDQQYTKDSVNYNQRTS